MRRPDSRGEPWKTNRTAKRAAKKRTFYCGCDVNRVGPGQRCEVCRRVNGRRRDKKG